MRPVHQLTANTKGREPWRALCVSPATGLTLCRPAIGSTKLNSMVTGPWRCEAEAKRAYYRGTKRISAAKFPEMKDSIAALDIQDAIIDGEIVALDEKGRSSFHWSVR